MEKTLEETTAEACRTARQIAKMGLDGADPINMLARIMDLMDPIVNRMDREDRAKRKDPYF